MFLFPGEDSRIKLFRIVFPIFRAAVLDPLTWDLSLNDKISIEPMLMVVTIFYDQNK